MTPQIFEAFGKYGGLGGLALAIVLFVFRDVIRSSALAKLSKKQATQILQMLIATAALVAVVGIFTWRQSSDDKRQMSHVRQVTKGESSPAINGVAGNVIINGGNP